MAIKMPIGATHCEAFSVSGRSLSVIQDTTPPPVLRWLIKWMCIGLLMTGGSHLEAQQSDEDFPSEVTEEIDNQLREAKINLENETRRARHTEQRVALLSEMRRLIVEMHSLEEKLEQAESESSASVEEIERRFEQVEISIGRQERRLGIHELKGELLELLHEVTRIDQESSQRALKRQLEQMAETADLIERQFQAWLAGEEEVMDAIE